MKTKLLSLLVLALIGWSASAQQTQLWGTASTGGTDGSGTIFSADASGSNLHTVYNFVNATGAMPVGKMCQANNGDLYGCTWLGGYGDSCVCFKYDIITGAYTDIHDLYQNTATGWDAWSGMMVAGDGNLYGTCGAGGANGGGALFKIDVVNGDTYSDIFDFSASNGTTPLGGLIQLSDGNLYGMTYTGGANNFGVIFSFNPVTSLYTKLYVFDGTNGGNPQYGSLMQGADGKLYGMTESGGANNYGVIFSFDLGTGNYTNLYNFDGTHGASPQGSLVQTPDGTLYGMTGAGGSNSDGVIFSFNITTNGYNDLLDFNSINGSNPHRSLTIGSSGMLFGTTNGGGANSAGVAFSYDITTSTYTKLVDFDASTTGSGPDAELAVVVPPVTTGVATINGSTDIRIYPNPASDYLIISNSDKDQVIQFVDILGRDLGTIKTSALVKTTVDVTDFPNVFFVKLQTGETQKIVKE